MNDSRLPFWREGSRESGRSDGYGMAHSQSFATGSGRAWSGHCGQAANDERHSLGVAHGRAVARPARTIWQVEFGLRALHPLEQARGVGCSFETLASLGPPDEEHAIDSTIVRAHQHAAGAKGGIKIGKRSAARAAASPRKSTFARTLKAIR